jgi:diguanylate cyclase (GGDEF)-like protein
MSMQDGLTGIANRRRFDEALQSEWRRNGRTASALSVVMIDVDHFKKFNDRNGHLAGDDCLRKVATAMQHALKRPGDLLARYGGEEFVAILPATPLSGGLFTAQQLHDAVVSLAIPHGASATAEFVTVSVGVASCVPEHHAEPGPLVARADAMLYKAKEAGRNQVQGARLFDSSSRPPAGAADAKAAPEQPMAVA